MVRCKFACISKREYRMGNSTLFDYAFTPVIGGSEENERFWRWSPSGALNVATVRDNQFVVGAAYYLDIAEAVE